MGFRKKLGRNRDCLGQASIAVVKFVVKFVGKIVVKIVGKIVVMSVQIASPNASFLSIFDIFLIKCSLLRNPQKTGRKT